MMTSSSSVSASPVRFASVVLIWSNSFENSPGRPRPYWARSNLCARSASVGGHAAVDVEDLARDPLRCVRSEEEDTVGDFLGEAKTLKRNSLHRGSLVLWRTGEAGQHAGVRRPGRDGVHPNSRLGELERYRFGDAFDGVLGPDVDRGESRAPVSVGRGDVDDATAALGQHRAHFVLHAQDHAENIGLERRGKTFRSLIRDRTNLPFGGGVVHGDIETAKPRDGLVDHAADVSLLANVGVDELGLRPQRAQLLDELLANLVAPAGNDHLGTLFGERDGSRAANAGETAGNQDNWL